MSSNLTLTPVGAVAASRAVPTATTSATPAPAPVGSNANTPAGPSPSYRIDPALGIVVIEFLSASGQVRNSLPTQQQLAAYHRSLDSGAQPDLGIVAD